MSKIWFFILSISLSGVLVAQEDNLVPNWSFDEPVKGNKIKLKELQQIEEAMGWTSPTEPKADLYTEESKSELVSVPMNSYGREVPEEGCCYAGILAYSYKDKAPRTYVQTELTQALEANQYYCVSFNVSLSDISKYAVNNLGAALTNEALTANEIRKFKVEPQVQQIRNKIMEDQYIWEDVCMIYKAKGGEKFITIGNFAPEDQIENKRLKKSRAFTQPQTPDAYYYLENVKVTLTDTAKGCRCKSLNIDKKEMEVIMRKWESGDAEQNPELLLEYKKISFNPTSKVLNETAQKTVKEVAAILNQKPELKVEVIGQTDALEELKMSKAKIDLSKKRVDEVIEALVVEGVNKSNLIAKALKDSNSTQSKDDKVLKEDRIVYFKISSN